MSFRLKVGVVGAGAWGTALANALARAGREVLLWGRDAQALVDVAQARENTRHLPGVPLEARVTVAPSLTVMGEMAAVLVVVPTQALRQVCEALALVLPQDMPVIACAKGIERGSGRFVTEIIEEALPQAVPAILSGPSFAADVARGLPTAVTLAAAGAGMAQGLSVLVGSPSFRAYHTTDIRGVEIGGAAKNVIAIACGVARGLQLGDSAVAALTTRGFAEMVRFGRAFGAKPETLSGLSGLGDLVLTATSAQSRNFSLGLALARGETAQQLMQRGILAEGAFTAQVLRESAAARGIDMPIVAAVDDVVAGRMSLQGAIDALLNRPQRGEGEA
jgi:glycerol-3-phosphate dehydrogenase (NAD(P)+)